MVVAGFALGTSNAMAIQHYSPTKSSKKVSSVHSQKDKSGIFIGDDKGDVWRKTREACTAAIKKAFENITPPLLKHGGENNIEPSTAAVKYDAILFQKHGGSLDDYKIRFRKDLVALKSSKTNFAKEILTGSLSIKEFVEFDDKDLLSKKQKEKDVKALQGELKSKMGKQFPTNIRDIKNQNNAVTEQWWIPESASKIDPEFELE